MINRSNVEIYLDLILSCKLTRQLKNHHLHGVVLLSIYKMLEAYEYNQAMVIANEKRLQIKAYLETMVFLSTFDNLEQYLLPSPLLAKLSKEEFQVLQAAFGDEHLFADIDLQNYKHTLFSLHAYRQLKSLLSHNTQFDAINAKIDFPLFNANANRYLQKIYLQLAEMMGMQDVSVVQFDDYYQRKTHQAQFFAQSYLHAHSSGMHYKAHSQNPNTFIQKQLTNQENSSFKDFASLSRALFLLRKEKQVFCMNLTVQMDNDTSHTEKLYYRYSTLKPSGFKLIALDEVSMDTPILTMDMRCKTNPQSNGPIEPCFRERSIEMFMKKFKTIPIENLIHLSSADAIPTHQSASKDLDINLKQINFKIFQAVRGVAEHYKPLIKIENLRLELQEPRSSFLKIPSV